METTVKRKRIFLGIYILINVIFLYVLVKNNYIYYAADDDFYMSLAVSGAYGDYSPYMLFSNAVYRRLSR